MTDYIKRKDAIDEIDKWLDVVGTALIGHGMSYYGELIGCIQDAPTADVAEVVRGKWIYKKRFRGEVKTYEGEDEFGEKHRITVDERREVEEPFCPVCGKLSTADVLNYCPNCGAKLDGR